MFFQFRDYDRDTLLEASQSVCIFIILQALDHESLEKNDTKSLISALSVSHGPLYRLSVNNLV
jgi:hypothetical protein